MDRFIEAKLDVIGNFDSHLKSNMDRFIDYYKKNEKQNRHNLKSNMDRFIVFRNIICLINR